MKGEMRTMTIPKEATVCQVFQLNLISKRDVRSKHGHVVYALNGVHPLHCRELYAKVVLICAVVMRFTIDQYIFTNQGKMRSRIAWKI